MRKNEEFQRSFDEFTFRSTCSLKFQYFYQKRLCFFSKVDVEMFHRVSRVSMKFSALNRRSAIRWVKFHLIVVHILSNRFRSKIFIEKTKQNESSFVFDVHFDEICRCIELDFACHSYRDDKLTNEMLENIPIRLETPEEFFFNENENKRRRKEGFTSPRNSTVSLSCIGRFAV